MSRLSSEEIDLMNEQGKDYDITNPRSLDIYSMVSDNFTEDQKKEGFRAIISFLLKNMPERKELFNKDYYELKYSNLVMDLVIKNFESYFPKTIVKQSMIHGNGVFAEENIKKGTLITFYPIHYLISRTGGKMLVSDKILQKNLKPAINLNEYVLTGNEKELYVVVGHPELYEDYQNGHIINHSNVPNTYFQLINGNKDYKCNVWGIVSTKDIKKGTELAIDYGPRADKLLECSKLGTNQFEYVPVSSSEPFEESEE